MPQTGSSPRPHTHGLSSFQGPQNPQELTSRRRSLGSRWKSHFTMAWGERGWHSRKAALPATPYCTASTVFLLAVE